jgi:hypothetical protein
MKNPNDPIGNRTRDLPAVAQCGHGDDHIGRRERNASGVIVLQHFKCQRFHNNEEEATNERD